MNQDNSHSWVRISYGTVKYVIDSIQDNTENPADSQEEEDVPTSTNVVAARSKAKSKPQPRVLVDTPTIIPMHERKWIEETDQSSSTQSNVTEGGRWSD